MFEWTEQKEAAALHVAQDDLTEEQIAERVGCARRTLQIWKADDAFAARVAEHVDAFRATIRKRGISVMENRVRHLQDRHRRLNRVMYQRAADPAMKDVPGGDTGLLVRTVKSIPTAEGPKQIDLYEVDTGLLKELREHEKQAAQELGQWLERKEVSGEVAFHPITLDGDKEANEDDGSGNGEVSGPATPPPVPKAGEGDPL